ncbi:hypothetical protein NC661_08255 [Aquibacillus koreensis]|uniref:Uncharacterized protein n=1 Tax=Aquibacillus koreensis TaxID=279446 RepID=A0A9X4AJF7_9BACI|nr:hypothetical protein [Aquibacillus koreensis]MCT2535899.1 hypothetical protein [Aquibacillus koreensis]MDC3420355.1 hypothetical protein [Aquibacillus koreensis]
MIELQDLDTFKNAAVKVCIHGKQGEDQAPWQDKKVYKVELCPDQTHVRIYFDDHYFFAVPLHASVEQNENEWIAYDQDAKLYYAINIL